MATKHQIKCIYLVTCYKRGPISRTIAHLDMVWQSLDLVGE